MLTINKKVIKILIWAILILLITLSIIIAYLFNKPHRNVQKTDAYAEMTIKDLLNEFSSNSEKANAKYLSGDGNSKVLIVQGPVFLIRTNQNNEKVVLLKQTDSKVGVSCTFTLKSLKNIKDLVVGETIKVKGAITAGNSYDTELDLYNHAILVQCEIIK